MEVHDLHLKSQVKEKGQYTEYSLKLTCLFAKWTDVRSGDYEIFLDALWISRCSLFFVFVQSAGHAFCWGGSLFTRHLRRKNDSVVIQCRIYGHPHTYVFPKLMWT